MKSYGCASKGTTLVQAESRSMPPSARCHKTPWGRDKGCLSSRNKAGTTAEQSQESTGTAAGVTSWMSTDENDTRHFHVRSGTLAWVKQTLTPM